ncbi:MAG: class I SAM-dependent methyltransferase [Chitinophagaceae bacterium]
MRQENLSRLHSLTVKKKSLHYIHLHFLMKDIKQAIDSYSKGDFLDLGCGNKPYEEWYNAKSTSQSGCDIAQSDKQRVDIICPADQLAYPDNKFDTILCTQVLEHVYNQRGVVQESFRTLRKDGHLILTVPFCWELHEEPYDFFRVTKYGLKQMFEDAGFSVISIKGNGGKWAASFQMMLNSIYSSFKYRTFRSRVVKFFFLNFGITWLINMFAVWLDKRYFDDGWTLNYIVVAKKN